MDVSDQKIAEEGKEKKREKRTKTCWIERGEKLDEAPDVVYGNNL